MLCTAVTSVPAWPPWPAKRIAAVRIATEVMPVASEPISTQVHANPSLSANQRPACRYQSSAEQPASTTPRAKPRHRPIRLTSQAPPPQPKNTVTRPPLMPSRPMSCKAQPASLRYSLDRPKPDTAVIADSSASASSEGASGRRRKRSRLALAAGAGGSSWGSPRPRASTQHRLASGTQAMTRNAVRWPKCPARIRLPAPPPKKPIITPAICTALTLASSSPLKCSAAMPSVAMSWVALASEASASRPTAQPALATPRPSVARPSRQARTMHCIGRIQLRRRPRRRDQWLSTQGAQRNLTTQGSPTRGRKASACNGAPSWRRRVGRASMARPMGMPWDR